MSESGNELRLFAKAVDAKLSLLDEESVIFNPILEMYKSDMTRLTRKNIDSLYRDTVKKLVAYDKRQKEFGRLIGRTHVMNGDTKLNKIYHELREYFGLDEPDICYENCVSKFKALVNKFNKVHSETKLSMDEYRF